MTTLREILDEYDFPEDEAELREKIGWYAVHRLTSAVWAWAYGQEVSCPDCWTYDTAKTITAGTGCKHCHGTGTIREPGLVERLGHEHSAECWSNYNDPTTPTCGQPSVSVLDALREELGVD